MTKRYKTKINKAFTDLGKIDSMHEKGKLTLKQHNTRSKKVLERLVKQVS